MKFTLPLFVGVLLFAGCGPAAGPPAAVAAFEGANLIISKEAPNGHSKVEVYNSTKLTEDELKQRVKSFTKVEKLETFPNGAFSASNLTTGTSCIVSKGQARKSEKESGWDFDEKGAGHMIMIVTKKQPADRPK